MPAACSIMWKTARVREESAAAARRFPADTRPLQASGDLCDQLLGYAFFQGDEPSLSAPGSVMREDGVLNQLPPWDSLCSQQWVMSVPGALKLTLIIALKMITKQQELADVSGGRRVPVDDMRWSQRATVCAMTPLSLYCWRTAQLQGPERSVWSCRAENDSNQREWTREKECFMILKPKIKAGSSPLTSLKNHFVPLHPESVGYCGQFVRYGCCHDPLCPIQTHKGPFDIR